MFPTHITTTLSNDPWTCSPISYINPGDYARTSTHMLCLQDLWRQARARAGAARGRVVGQGALPRTALSRGGPQNPGVRRPNVRHCALQSEPESQTNASALDCVYLSNMIVASECAPASHSLWGSEHSILELTSARQHLPPGSPKITSPRTRTKAHSRAKA